MLNALLSGLGIYVSAWYCRCSTGTVLPRLVGVVGLWRELDFFHDSLELGLDGELLRLSLPAAESVS